MSNQTRMLGVVMMMAGVECADNERPKSSYYFINDPEKQATIEKQDDIVSQLKYFIISNLKIQKDDIEYCFI